MVVDESDVKGVNLVLEHAKIETSKKLTEYYIKDDSKSPTLSQKDKREINFNIVFIQRLTTEAVMTFFPTFLFISTLRLGCRWLYLKIRSPKLISEHNTPTLQAIASG